MPRSTSPAKKTAKGGTTKASPAKKASSATKRKATAPPAKATKQTQATASKAKSTKAAAPTKAAIKAKGAPAKSTKSTAPSSASKAKKATKAPAAKKTAAKSPFPAKWLTEREEELRDQRANYLRQADSLRAEADSLVADFEPGDVQFDEESGEGDTLNTERERDLALSAQARQAVEEIDRALTKMADGTYGICEVSGDPIPKERLEAIPWARERVEYKTGGLGRR